MQSSTTRFETPTALWTQLARLRDLSRLVLAAAADSDLERMQRYCGESEALVAALAPEMKAHADDAEAQRLLLEISGLQERVRTEVQALATETARELALLRSTRGRFRGLRLHGTDSDAAHVNRSS